MGTEMFQTGLEARISPPLTFTEERKVLIPSDQDKEYTVSLIVKAHNSIRTKGRWQAKRKFTFSSAIIDSFLKRSRGYTRLKEEGNPSERNPSQSSSSVQLSHKKWSDVQHGIDNEEQSLSSTDRLREGNTVKRNDNWRFFDRRKCKFKSGTFYTGWKITWRNLEKLIETKALLISPEATRINPQAYIKNNPGIYSFIWDNKLGPRLYFGKAQSKKKMTEFMPEDELSLLMMYGSSKRLPKSPDNINSNAPNIENSPGSPIRFDFGYEFIGLPKEICSTIKDEYLLQFFPLENGFYKSSVDTISAKYCGTDIALYLILNNEEALLIEPYRYIQIQGGSSYFPVEVSEGDTYVLGTTFLRKYSVNVDTREGKMRYQIDGVKKLAEIPQQERHSL
ncbi:hypothetical protein ABG067_005557 [Albugo candida]